MNKYNEIKAHYQRLEKQIMTAKKNEWGIDPYAWDGLIDLTPIEYALWQDIRSLDMVFYPQYPVGRYFVDFGNPRARVAIECDGAAYHQDKEADMKRQKEIQAMGWAVYRFTGRECKEPQPERGHGEPFSTYMRMMLIASLHGLSNSDTLIEEALTDEWVMRGVM